MNSTKRGPVFEGGTCRCCGITKKCRLLNAEYEFCGQKEIYFEMFVDCFGLVLSHLEGEEMDRLICATCVMRLRDASAFRQQVLQCEEKLLKIQMQVDDDSNKQTKDSDFDLKLELEECNAPEDVDNDYEHDNVRTYKVVETIENGEKVLTSIPGSWERDGKLKWPRKNKAEKFRNHDKPDDDWDTTNCIVKKRRLATYKDAENVIKSICQSGESIDIDVMEQTGSNNRQLHSNSQNTNTQKVTANHTVTSKKTAFTALKDANSNTHNRPVNAEYSQMPVIANVMNSNNITNVENLNERTCNSTEHINNANIKQLLSKILRLETQLKDVSTKIRSVLDNQINLIYNQDNVSLQVEQLSDTFKEFFPRLPTSYEGNIDDTFDFLPVESEEDFEKLESKLKEPEFKMELTKKFSFTFGKENGNGANVAYRLIDMFFNRHFLTLCSWSGGSRHYDKKICFKAHTNVIQFFLKMIQASDEEFTLDACENFLKNILKSSVKRSMNLNMRKSVCKKRVKRGKRNLIHREKMNDRAIDEVGDKHNDTMDRVLEKIVNEHNNTIDRDIEEIADEQQLIILD